MEWGSSIGGIIGTGIGSFGGPITAGIGGMIGSSLGSLFDKKKGKEDPLAGLRSQLQAISNRQMALAERVPGLVAEQKRLIGERFGEERTKGIESIGERVYAEGGMGRTSIFDRLRTELVDRLARSQAEAELAADYQGLQTQGSILGQAANVLGSTSGMYTPEEPSTLSKILGWGANLVGQQLGLQGLKDIINPKATPSYATGGRSFFTPETWSDILASRKGSALLSP
jgi:hypothetical protein